MAGILDVFDKVTVIQKLAAVLEKAEVIDFLVDVKNKSIKVELGLDEIIPRPELFAFSDQVKDVYNLQELEIKVKYNNIEFSEKYYRNLLVGLFKKCSICKAFLVGSSGELENDVLTVKNVKCGKEILEKNKCAQLLEELASYELGRKRRYLVSSRRRSYLPYH